MAIGVPVMPMTSVRQNYLADIVGGIAVFCLRRSNARSILIPGLAELDEAGRVC